MKHKSYLTALTVSTAASVGSAYAANTAKHDAIDFGMAKISMTQAITAAAQHAGGKAARAEYEQHKDKRCTTLK